MKNEILAVVGNSIKEYLSVEMAVNANADMILTKRLNQNRSTEKLKSFDYEIEYIKNGNNNWNIEIVGYDQRSYNWPVFRVVDQYGEIMKRNYRDYAYVN